MARRTIFISDIHMGDNSPTNWFQDSVHRTALKGILRYIQREPDDIGDVVMLGDWFDQWNYAPDKGFPDVKTIMDSNPAVFTRQHDQSGDFVTVMERIQGCLRYVNGNHDMLVSLKDINGWFANITDKQVHPGCEDGVNKGFLKNIQYESGPIYAEHGHMYDPFDRPARMKENRHCPLPIGHFSMRTVAQYVIAQLNDHQRQPLQNAAQLPDSGVPRVTDLCGDLRVIVDTVSKLAKRRRAPNLPELILDVELAFARRCFAGRSDGLTYEMSWPPGTPSVTSDEVGRFYPGLLSRKQFKQDLSWLLALTGISVDCFAGRLFRKTGARVVVLGHTHHYKLWQRGQSDRRPIYVNSGYNCAALPDMKAGRKKLTFVETIENPGREITVNLNAVDFEDGAVRILETRKTDWE